MNPIIKIAIADDHSMLRQALTELIESFGNYKVILQANNGKELLHQLKPENLPDLVLLDINMPAMDGISVAKCLRDNYPDIKILALGIMDNEESIIGMIRNGARGYLLKDAEPAQLREALHNVVHKGFHLSEF